MGQRGFAGCMGSDHGCSFSLHGVFHSPELLKLIDFVRICFKRNEFLSAVVKSKANMSVKISLQWLYQDLTS